MTEWSDSLLLFFLTPSHIPVYEFFQGYLFIVIVIIVLVIRFGEEKVLIYCKTYGFVPIILLHATTG